MKRVLLTIAVLGTIFLSACEKEETLVPAEETVLKSDKGISCRGCADWDLTNTATYDGETDTVSTPATGN